MIVYFEFSSNKYFANYNTMNIYYRETMTFQSLVSVIMANIFNFKYSVCVSIFIYKSFLWRSSCLNFLSNCHGGQYNTYILLKRT